VGAVGIPALRGDHVRAPRHGVVEIGGSRRPPVLALLPERLPQATVRAAHGARDPELDDVDPRTLTHRVPSLPLVDGLRSVGVRDRNVLKPVPLRGTKTRPAGPRGGRQPPGCSRRAPSGRPARPSAARKSPEFVL